jgi:hypothetical protein
MSFSFNFLPEHDTAAANGSDQRGSVAVASDLDDADSSPKNAIKADVSQSPSSTSFHWLPNDLVKNSVKAALQDLNQLFHASETIHLSEQQPSNSSSRSLSTIRRIQEDVVSAESTTQFRKTDLVPGVYEGGLKVWECSMDLCRYLHDHTKGIALRGQHVLELGCGHGLPACWILKQALHQNHGNLDMDCFVVFSDYNEFVLRDVTIHNVMLNIVDDDDDASVVSPQLVSEWVSSHVAFGAGDWNVMSKHFLQNSDNATAVGNPAAVPTDGLFDIILAAETTYSETAAVETAALIARHLRPRKGVAYVATKRYYFGVRGGTSCLVDALNQNTDRNLAVEVLQVYDNGAGNIRELLSIQDA